MAGSWPLVGRDDEIDQIDSALRRRTTSCVLLSGVAGVGKTRLAREAVARLERDHRPARWVIATEQTGAIPLGAAAPLLRDRPPVAARSDRTLLLDWAWQRLTAARPARDLLVVDDAPLLDELSAALITRLVRTGTSTSVLLTARDRLPAWIAELTGEGRVEHVRVQPLAEPDVTTLTEAALDGVADAATHALLWAHSGGNPLRLRQLVGQGLERGVLRAHEHVYRWDGPLGTGELDELLAARLGSVPDPEARALELAAVGEPLPAGVVRELGIATAVEALVARELMEQDATGCYRTAHPLYGSVTRARMPALVRDATRRRLADAFTAAGRLTEPDLLRVARWRLDTGERAEPSLLLAAARHALVVDSGLAERLARAASEGDPEYGALHVLGRALFDQRRSDEAGQVLRQLLAGPLSVEQQLGVILELAMIKAWCDGDAAGAIADLRAAEAEFGPHAALIAGMRGAVELFRGEPGRALAAALPIATDVTYDARVRFLAALDTVPALAMMGRLDEALALAGWARAAAPGPDFAGAVPSGPTFADAHLEWAYAYALRWAGRIDDAVETARAALQRAVREANRHTQSYGLLNAAAGGALLAAGNVRDARGPLRVGASALRKSDVCGSVVSCLADLARVEALTGDASAARELVREAAERTTPATRVFDAALARARSVVAAMSGDRAGARTQASTGAQRARDAGQAVLEAACLHLLVRFGDAAAACERLAELAATTDAGLVSIFAAHAEAEVQRAGGPLALVAARFDAAGARMLAAHTAASAARAYRRVGRGADAKEAARLSRAYAARCPDAPAPQLLAEPVPLTTRERDVVELARRGMANQQIAGTLGVSVRTVETHLRHAYRKLGVRGRAQLLGSAISAR